MNFWWEEEREPTFVTDANQVVDAVIAEARENTGGDIGQAAQNVAEEFDATQFVGDLETAAKEQLEKEQKKRRIRWAISLGVVALVGGYLYWRRQ